MAFYSKLNDQRALEIYNELNSKISEEAQAMYCANKKRAGCYKGVWFELQSLWLDDKVPNFHVTDCLRVGQVLDYDLSDAVDLMQAIETDNVYCVGVKK